MDIAEHRLTLPDGRTLALDDYGTADGPVVLFLTAAPGSRRLDPDPAATAAAGVRLLVVDRPGYGDSTPLPAGPVPTVGGLADDVAAALDALGVERAGVVGWSAGGRIALALAARRPDLVRSLAVTGTPAPDEEVPWIGDDVRQLIEQLRADVPGAVAAVTPMLAGMFGSPESRAASVSGGPADEAVLADPVLAGRLDGMLDEALRQGTIGLGIDLVAGSVIPADFDPAAVTAPVALFYGAAEVIVPPEHGRWWAERLPAATLHEVPGAGHLLPLTAWADILAALS